MVRVYVTQAGKEKLVIRMLMSVVHHHVKPIQHVRIYQAAIPVSVMLDTLKAKTYVMVS